MNWEKGRQGTGYQKLLIFASSVPLPFDCWLLRMPRGAEVPYHFDPIEGRRHFRLNIVLKRAYMGGEFYCIKTLFWFGRICWFRPDLCEHKVNMVQDGTRYVLSIGWAPKDKIQKET